MTSHSVAAVLADELSRAVFALDTDGSICLVNAAFETLIEQTRDQLLTRPLVERTPPERRAALLALVAAAFQSGGRRGEIFVDTGSGARLLLSLRMVPAGEHDTTILVCLVDGARLAEPRPCRPIDETFEVRIDDLFGEIVATDHVQHLGHRCHEVVAGLDHPCPGCPLKNGSFSDDADHLIALPDQRLLLMHVTRATRQSVRIGYRMLASGTLDEAIVSRLSGHAERHNLSQREREVFLRLVLGKSLDEIAGDLRITQRTVRFHQENLLAKFGLQSRFELARLAFQTVSDT